MKIIKSFVLAFIVLTAGTSVVLSQTTNQSQQADTLKTASIKVKGIGCSTDIKMISTNVEKLQGVGSCKAGKLRTTTTFEIIFNPALVSESEIHAAIEGTGGCENPNDRPYQVKP